MTPHDDDPLPGIEYAKQLTGLDEDGLTRKFMLHLIDVEGKNPFTDMPAHFMREAMQKYPDIVDKARRKFGNF